MIVVIANWASIAAAVKNCGSPISVTIITNKYYNYRCQVSRLLIRYWNRDRGAALRLGGGGGGGGTDSDSILGGGGAQGNFSY